MKEINDLVQGNSYSRQNVRDNELDLLDIVAQIWKGKVVIIAIMILSLLLSILYINFAAEKWTSKAIVSLPAPGQVANYNATLSVLYSQTPNDKPSISDLQGQLFGRFISSLNALSGSLKNLEVPLILKVEQVNNGDNGYFLISFVSSTASQAQKQLTQYISEIDKRVVSEYGDDIKRNASVKTKELSDVLDAYKQVAINKKQHRIDVINQALKVAQDSNIEKSQLSQAEYLSDDTLYLLGSEALSAMIKNEETKPLEFDSDYYAAERSLLSVTHLKIMTDNLDSFRYIAKSDLPFRRDSPKSILIIIISLIFGSVLGTTIVIGRNIITTYRSRN